MDTRVTEFMQRIHARAMAMESAAAKPLHTLKAQPCAELMPGVPTWFESKSPADVVKRKAYLPRYMGSVGIWSTKSHVNERKVTK